MPAALRLSTCQPAKSEGTSSSSLNGPRSSAMRLVGTMAWPPAAAAAISTAAAIARRVSTGSDMLRPRSVGARDQPAQAAVGGDDEHERRHEQHEAGEAVQEA